MKLKYVGAMPLISDKGVGFDHTQPDKYTLHLHNIRGKEYKGEELTSVLKKYCPTGEKETTIYFVKSPRSYL
ncbi:hypothetical protein JHD50_02020 [Sulfurimonas sp. MAG313]|nr:hypothetical protein [Sulfurimonas sp. MAG313]MDF1880087.1 hypothetical protein [Sulfurimonas sp. MAG313]